MSSSDVSNLFESRWEIRPLLPSRNVAASAIAAKLYAELTPGYQRDWARYIYSAKQAATQEKRRTEMLDILGKGHKTKNLYQQWLKEQ